MLVGILLFESVDLLDAGGPYEVFLTASRLARRNGESAPFDVVTIGVTTDPVTAYGGLRVIPHLAAADVERIDVLVVPGAIVIDGVIGDERVLRAVGSLADRSRLTASVCTGAFILAAYGMLDGRPWTTHWEDIPLLAGRIGSAGATRGVRWVDDGGDVVTSGGLSSGIAMALHLVDRFAGRDLAVRTARQIDYAWDPAGAR